MSEINEALLEGESANNWTPGVWANTPTIGEDEWQPDIEPPHINDYAAFKKHKHYGKYFRPYRYTPFPAWVYHKTQEPKIVNSKEEVLSLGPGWSPKPNKIRIDMTGKSHPVKSETQRLAETVALALASKPGSGAIDATAIASIVAAVMAATQAQKPVETAPLKMTPIAGEIKEGDVITGDDRLGDRATVVHVEGDIERAALIELAEKNEVKIDKRWGNDRIKKELGI